MKNIQIDRDVLYDLYIIQNMSVIEVAKILNVSKFTINDRLKRYGIKKDKDSISLQREKTNLEKYGVGCTLQSEQVKEKVKKTNLEKYGVENPMYLKEVKEKISASLLNNNFPNVIKYFADWKTTEDFLKKNYNEKTTLIQLSKDTGVSIAAVGRYIHKYGSGKWYGGSVLT